MASPEVVRQRRIVAVVALAVFAALVVFLVTQLTGSDAAEPQRAADGAEAEQGEPTPTPEPPMELPRGGRTILPDYRVVAYYGAPQDDELGALGIGSPPPPPRSSTRRRRAMHARRGP